jgi:nucleotide-binding universal stress UspA family protein
MYKHILIPTDGTELSTRTIRKGIEFARENGARVTVLTCSLPLRAFGPQVAIDEKRYVKATKDIADQRLQEAARFAQAAGVEATLRHLYDERPAEAIVETAEREACDLVYMASSGKKGLEALMLGSETRKVLARTRLPVLICR